MGITPQKDRESEKTIIVRRNTENYMSIIAIIALLNLVALTYPHASSSRYPKVPTSLNIQEKGTGLGYQDYDHSLGIVNRLGRLGQITGLMLGKITPQLKEIAMFFEIEQSSSVRADPQNLS